MTVTVDAYVVTIEWDVDSHKREPYIKPLADALREAEENITDLLPPGYSARIRRWDEGDEDGDT